MLSEIVLHIGSEKTGSTTIQSFLDYNRASLLSQQIIVPKSLGKNHYRLPIVAKELTICSDKEKYTDAENVKGLLEREVERCVNNGATRLVLSSELIHSRLCSEDEIANLISLLPPSYLITVIWYVRRQDRAALSLYSTWLKSGHYGPFSYPDLNHKSLPYRFDYWRAYRLWAKVVGANRINTIVYDDVEVREDLIKNFCMVAGIRWSNDFMIPDKENTSLDVNGLYLMSLFSKYNSEHKHSQGHPKKLKEFISEKFCSGKRLNPDRDSALRFYNHFSDVNESLRSACFSDRDALFDHDFSSYSVGKYIPEIDHELVIAHLLQYISEMHRGE
jgi:hypothetical protein